MYFVSGIFILFVLITVLVYYLVPGKYQWVVLLAGNIVFYLWGGPWTGIYLLVTTVSTFTAGLLLDELNIKKKDIPKDDITGAKKNRRLKKSVVAASLLINFGMLFAVKYLDFTIGAFANAFLHTDDYPVLGLVMPVGISFYIFQSVGYVIDCYRNKYRAERNPLKFAVFTSYFPQMVQGPISRYDKLAPQFFKAHRFDAENMRDGIQRVMWGYFKKMIIADRAAVIVNSFFSDYENAGGAVTAFAIIMYCINLYCDFSGGIDITIGISKMLGIELAENFKRPIFARSLSEYWRRWHITLGTWMRDYVFYSITLSKPFMKLSQSARKKIKGRAGKIITTSIATFIVYLLIGIWHGANFRYIFYGVWNGAIITVSLLLEGVYDSVKKKLGIKDDSKPWAVFSVIRTAFIVFIGRYITRAPRLTVAFMLIGRTFNPGSFRAAELWDGTVLNMGLKAEDLIIIAVSVVIVLIIEWYEEKHDPESFGMFLKKRNGFIQWIAILIPLLVILFFGIMRDSYIASEFIYKQF